MICKKNRWLLLNNIKMEEVKISVITVCYNAVDTLEKTIQSVLEQTYHNIEYIIIDGGSTDGTVEIIHRYVDYLAYWVSEPDRGIYDAMNKGIERATGEWVNFMNAGDYFYNYDVISNVFKVLQKADVMTGISFMDYPKKKRLWFPPQELSFLNLYNGTLSHQASFIRSSLLKKIGYDEKYKIVSDWKFYLQVLILSDASYIPLNLIVSRHDNAGVSSNIEEREKERENILNNLFPARILNDYKSFSKQGLIKKTIIYLFNHCNWLKRCAMVVLFVQDKRKLSRLAK